MHEAQAHHGQPAIESAGGWLAPLQASPSLLAAPSHTAVPA